MTRRLRSTPRSTPACKRLHHRSAPNIWCDTVSLSVSAKLPMNGDSSTVWHHERSGLPRARHEVEVMRGHVAVVLADRRANSESLDRNPHVEEPLLTQLGASAFADRLLPGFGLVGEQAVEPNRASGSYLVLKCVATHTVEPVQILEVGDLRSAIFCRRGDRDDHLRYRARSVVEQLTVAEIVSSPSDATARISPASRTRRHYWRGSSKRHAPHDRFRSARGDHYRIERLRNNDRYYEHPSFSVRSIVFLSPGGR